MSTDDGLTEAVQRAQRLLGCRATVGPRPGGGQVCALHHTHIRDGVCHMAQEVARAAREDVADLTLERCCDGAYREREDFGDYKTYTCADEGRTCRTRLVSPWREP